MKSVLEQRLEDKHKECKTLEELLDLATVDVNSLNDLTEYLGEQNKRLVELLLKSVYPHKYGGFKKADIELIESLTDYREVGQSLEAEVCDGCCDEMCEKCYP